LKNNITLGLEEEVFVVEPTLPTTRSLYYLSKLLWKNPRRNMKLTASNFARGKDLQYGLMSGIEVATDVCHSTLHLLSELQGLRGQVSKVCEGRIAPIGHLLQIDAPSNVCALQIHIGGLSDIVKTYDNIAYFLPLLILLGSHSPMRNGERFGQSYRLECGYATGNLTGDRHKRFQDLIITRRLGTIEVRAFDPMPCTARYEYLVNALVAIANLDTHKPLDIHRYARLRNHAIKHGLSDELRELHSELSEIVSVPLELFEFTESDRTAQLYNEFGLEGTYKRMDEIYRCGTYSPPNRSSFTKKVLQPTIGFVGYYAVKFPYITYKWLKERDK